MSNFGSETSTHPTKVTLLRGCSTDSQDGLMVEGCQSPTPRHQPPPPGAGLRDQVWLGMRKKRQEASSICRARQIQAWMPSMFLRACESDAWETDVQTRLQGAGVVGLLMGVQV